ncbi:MAG: 3-deoxy-8-phosphooctulonate synthase [Candidatus Melainabacteria bacterium RIFCSPLOWO2_02_FULL_35_15]|nr:MAG: 3-deoxy-8-phosphooctulonate synthase [Candidatus Melainabacteria bacterium RIFCSPLOWO2_12_FULL_35_11]OGI13553.1 MAG: 3-deoxy-8-phosphooctulonate synthase [Candidatus Melainabacteria bacterium RIFCSPLOWO2_02_FULL_35_15]
MKPVKLKNIIWGTEDSFPVIAGPCVIESRDLVFRTAEKLKNICEKLKLPFIFKSSYDKANRTSVNSFRGHGIEKGLEILAGVKKELGVFILSDVHEISEIDLVKDVLDIIQIPAFLCRQTNLILETAKTGKVVNIKKGQFLAPDDALNIVKKAHSTGNENILITERGTSFGYHNLVVDMRSFDIIHKFGVPVIFDSTHSVQLPGGAGTESGGQREFIPALMRAAVAAGCDGIFMETHPDPDNALSDGPNMVPLDKAEDLLRDAIRIRESIKKNKISA